MRIETYLLSMCMILYVSCSMPIQRVVEHGDIIRVHYQMTLLDGTRLDESYNKHAMEVLSQPLRIEVGKGQVIRGWDEALVGMKKGERKSIQIPPDMAYGEMGAPDNILPSDTLLLDIEMMGFVD